MQTRDVTLIADLAESIRLASPVQKDLQAAELIGHLIGSQPDALYYLVQTVIDRQEPGEGATVDPAGRAAPADRTLRGLVGRLGRK
jgi:uncharacterized protein